VSGFGVRIVQRNIIWVHCEIRKRPSEKTMEIEWFA